MKLEQLRSVPDVALAMDLALEVGAFLTKRPDHLKVQSKSSATDVVTHMDQAAERMIVERLAQLRPADGILGEEGAQQEGSSGSTWVIDPIDGTVNYLYNLPAWCVSIGLVENDSQQGIVGAVYAPVLNELYVSARGCGSYLFVDGSLKAIGVSDLTDLSHALIGTGFGYSADRRVGQARVLHRILAQFRDIRRIGSCALDLCFVASGKLDAYFERGVHPWDHAAGGLIAREAGAIVSGLRGSTENEELLVAAAPGIYQNLRNLLERYDADSDLP